MLLTTAKWQYIFPCLPESVVWKLPAVQYTHIILLRSSAAKRVNQKGRSGINGRVSLEFRRINNKHFVDVNIRHSNGNGHWLPRGRNESHVPLLYGTYGPIPTTGAACIQRDKWPFVHSLVQLRFHGASARLDNLIRSVRPFEFYFFACNNITVQRYTKSYSRHTFNYRSWNLIIFISFILFHRRFTRKHRNRWFSDKKRRMSRKIRVTESRRPWNTM